jgi:hypothetical protein
LTHLKFYYRRISNGDDHVEMKDSNISGDSLVGLIKENRKLFHENAHSTPGKYVPNAILIHPGY